LSPARTLSSLLNANGPYGRLVERSRLHRDLQSRLESILGPEIAGHYRIQNLRDGVLILQADASSWAARLRYELPRLLERLRATQGLQQLRDVQVRVTVPDQPRPKTQRRARLSREAATVLESAAAATQDPQLRDALQRLARRGNG
jgi:hypothetical protein